MANNVRQQEGGKGMKKPSKFQDFKHGQRVRLKWSESITGTVAKAYKENEEEWVEVVPDNEGSLVEYRKDPSYTTWNPGSLVILEDVFDTTEPAAYYHAVVGYEA